MITFTNLYLPFSRDVSFADVPGADSAGTDAAPDIRDASEMHGFQLCTDYKLDGFYSLVQRMRYA